MFLYIVGMPIIYSSQLPQRGLLRRPARRLIRIIKSMVRRIMCIMLVIMLTRHIIMLMMLTGMLRKALKETLKNDVSILQCINVLTTPLY